MHIIAGKYKNKILKAPKGDLTRPTSGNLRETLFNICQAYVEDALFLDLFAGSGAMGLEALSRGASSATFIDNSREAIRCITHNVEHLHAGQHTQIIYGNVFHQIEKLASLRRSYNIIYADPPYDSKTKWKGEELSFSGCVVKMIDQMGLLSPGGILFIEDSARSLPCSEGLENLVLKNSRRMGRAALQQYILRENENG